METPLPPPACASAPAAGLFLQLRYLWCVFYILRDARTVNGDSSARAHQTHSAHADAHAHSHALVRTHIQATYDSRTANFLLLQVVRVQAEVLSVAAAAAPNETVALIVVSHS